MIQEAYVSFETAKLLKEKGFDVHGDGSYGSGIKVYWEYSPFGKLRDCSTSSPSEKAYPAPSQALAMRWFREVHNLHIIIDYSIPYKMYAFDISEDSLIDSFIYETYEEAVETAIKYCLENLI